MENVSQAVWVALGGLAAVLFASAMGLFNWKNHMPVEGKTILLTGASEGMGRSVALQLAAKGANLALVARNAARLEELVAECKTAAKNPSNQRFTFFTADITLENYAAPLLTDVKAWNDGRSPDIVWCIAGMASTGFWIDTPFAQTRRNMDVNFYGTAEMAHAILREWLAVDAPVEKEPKHLIMTTSVVAFFTIAGYGPYASSKWAIRGLADTLSQEVLLYPQNVKIHVVFPGTITSPGLEKENLTKPQITHQLEELDPVQSPEEVARLSIKGLERGDYFVTVAFLGSLMKWSGLGGSIRNNWVVDTFMVWITSWVWVFMLPDIMRQCRNYGKKHGHPATYPKPKAA
ncbi:3-ketodihydrosphingosine reductase gsl-3 [Colletotrichum gloeosporioides]|uniref:3-dehydrosphinganine reductase n=1 Tax=Colletotrichum gloeosporioides TaxID=474922 RepID=A0A8H4CK84_COLGL|nr:3-ketodihydrosphingosine reductase gsl-3 [Colletotrichum gloeosporioides]KAF3805321.1 3-ketodihydrosphingosine reductase gsl-3 [Colletotrichum gloeosporioides]